MKHISAVHCTFRESNFINNLPTNSVEEYAMTIVRVRQSQRTLEGPEEREGTGD